MKLWLLTKREDLDQGDRTSDPWYDTYDMMYGCVVRAETEAQARQIATDVGECEIHYVPDAWLNPAYSACRELTADGEAGLVIKDSLAG